MSSHYRVTTIVMSSGERLPMLLGADGLPVFEPTLFSLIEIRARNLASNTIESYLRSVMALLLFLGLRKIDLQARLNEGHLLSLGEIEELARICRLPMERIQAMRDEVESQPVKVAPALSLEKFRMRSPMMSNLEVSPEAAATRLRNIRDYLKWLGSNRMSNHGINAMLKNSLESSVQQMVDAINARLFMALGQRPIQYAALKVCDVGTEETKDGVTMYTLRVPRAKQRGRLSRELFSQRVLIPQIGDKLVQYANEVRSDFSAILADSGQAPLFPAKSSRQNEPVGFESHRTSQSLASTLEEVLNKLNIVSERTGEQLHVTATRFRRTVGTRAAEEGHGELVIAELLDHTDTQNVGVYVQATPEIVKRIDKAVAMHMAPLAQAFAGVIISDESEATRKNDPTSRICDPKFEPSMKPMGNCGKHGFCDSLAPIACYTCRSFEPWLDGPHEAVLNHLIAERDRLMAGSDTRIASINDRTILAVAEVVRRCEEIRREVQESLIV